MTSDLPVRLGSCVLSVLRGYAAISKLAGMLFMQCAMCGFVGPEEVLLIFRNPETISRFVPNTSMTAGQDRVDIMLGNKGGWSTAPVL